MNKSILNITRIDSVYRKTCLYSFAELYTWMISWDCLNNDFKRCLTLICVYKASV